jgi:hypothetical protein
MCFYDANMTEALQQNEFFLSLLVVHLSLLLFFEIPFTHIVCFICFL